MQKIIKRYLPVSVRWAIREAVLYPIDLLDVVLGKRSPMVPPRRKMFVGGGDFLKQGDEFLGYFKELTALKPEAKVLDVGSGIGRMAIPMTQYLEKGGEYYGFDIVQDGVSWCTKNITSRYPNFHFDWAPIFNAHYNPKGTFSAAEYVFPYENNQFDLVILTSVFTHMLPKDVENYLSQIARVMRPGGRCLITLFLVNAESQKLTQSHLSSLDFQYDIGGCLSTTRSGSEISVAYDEANVRKLFQQNGLTIQEPIRYGKWCGRKEFLSYQDIVIATK